jgi:hypothetical protein
VQQLKATPMLPYKLDTTNDLLTSRAGLICVAQVMDQIPQASTLGEWLHKTSDKKQSFTAWHEVNKVVLKTTLHQCKKITLDIDANGGAYSPNRAGAVR